jgi:outer membrane receptor protein involved in Fe transport
MRHRLALGFGLVLLLASATSALAQRTTGTIVGTVSDESGAILPGVTVTLSGPGVAGTPTTVTTETGAYRFPQLPPGDYKLSFTLQGFATINREQVVVPLGGTVEINAQLKVSTLQETVTVTGESPIINAASTELSTNLNREWVQSAPQRRFTFFDLINQAAGVSPVMSTSSRSTSFGSSATDNSYQLDGTDFTAPFTGAAWPWPNTDAIEEVEVLSLGASAEYGNVQGAVFNVVTRQGSNNFHGDGNFYYQHQNLTGRNTTDAQDKGLPYHRDQFVDTTWQLGGPIARDKLWFFGSFQFQRDSESQPGTPPEFPAKSSAKRIFAKGNWQINKDQKVQAQVHDDFYDIPGRATALTAPSTIAVEHGHNPSPGVMWTSVLSNKTFVEARYSGFYGKDHGDPLQSGEPRVKPRFYDLDTGAITGGIYSWYDGKSWKSAVSGKVSHYAEKFMGGSHDLKLGVQFDSGGSDYATGLNDYIYAYGTTPSYGYTQLPYHQGGQKRSIGTYVDDTYRIGSRVTLNLGLRYDWSRASIRSYPILDAKGNETGASSPEVPNIFTWNSVSPRVGFIYRLNESGRTMLKAHVGRYYRGVVTSEFDNTTPSVTPRFLFDGTYVGGVPNPDSLEQVSSNVNFGVNRDFKNPYTDQYILGFEHELAANFGLQLNYIYKRGEDYGGWAETNGTYVPVPYVDNRGVDASGQTFQVLRLTSSPDDRFFQLTNPGQLFSRYKGFSIQANKRMSNNWQMTSSIVFSKSTGILGSSRPSTSTGTPTPIASQNSTAGTFGQNPNDYINSEGRLIGDRPIVAKLQFLYQAPFQILLGVNYTHQDGRLYGRQVRINGLGITTAIWAEPLDGRRRVPDWNTIDVRIQKDFSLNQQTRFGVFADILNLTNADTTESVLNQLGTTSDFGKPARFLYPRRAMLGAKIRF